MKIMALEQVLAAPRKFLGELFHIAVGASNPRATMKKLLPGPPAGRTVVVGAGKAAGEMALALEELWPHPMEGAVVSKHGSTSHLSRITLLTAAHPIPDAAGLLASATLLELVKNLTEVDLVIALISGGGSSLLPAPSMGLTLEDEIELNTILLASGAPISAINAIRKHFSKIKGGRLALIAAPARVVTFVVSDIPGDVLSQVASGPTIPDFTRRSDVFAMMQRYRIELPEKLTRGLELANETPLPSDLVFKRNEVHLLASASHSLEAAAKAAESIGLPAHILSDAIEGETRDIAKMHAAIALSVKRLQKPFKPPCVILSGGETTVTIRSQKPGKGGRNSEFLLSFADFIAGVDGIYAIAADTDGIDGSEENAGGFVDGDTIQAIRARGGNPTQLLSGHDSWSALAMAGCLFTTGQTGTNINDFRAILII